MLLMKCLRPAVASAMRVPASRVCLTPAAAPGVAVSRRQMSSALATRLGVELKEEMEESVEEPETILKNLKSPFVIKKITGAHVVLEHDGTIVTFNAATLEDSEDQTMRSMPVDIRVVNGNGLMLLVEATVTEGEVEEPEEFVKEDNNDEDDEEEEYGVVVDAMKVMPSDVSKVLEGKPVDLAMTATQYSPVFDDLDPELQQGAFDLLAGKGISAETALAVFQVAEVVERNLYVNWLKDCKSFAESLK